MNTNLNVNIDLPSITYDLAILKSKINSLSYAVGLLLDERQNEKFAIVEKICLKEEMINLFENVSDFNENSLLPEHTKIKNELVELEEELLKLK